jgi:hypothetical protein
MTSIEGGFASKSDLNNYVLRTSLPAILTDYVTKGAIKDYVTRGALDNDLAKYTTTADLKANYVTKGALAEYITGSALSDYITESALGGYVTGSAFDDYTSTGALEESYYDKAQVENLIMTSGGSMIVTPDYAKMEDTNRITTNNGIWKVDRNGYVYCLLFMASQNGSSNDVNIYINNKIVARTAALGSNPQRPNLSGVFPVSKDDVVQLWYNNNIAPAEPMGCWFIPPKYSKPPSPLIVPGGDYSFGEQPVMVNDGGGLRPKEWIDDKPIYQQVFTLTNVNIPVGNNSIDVLMSSGFDTLISGNIIGAAVQPGNPSLGSFNSTYSRFDETYRVIEYPPGSISLYAANLGSSPKTVSCDIIVEYTK